ncbi:DUF342 domain-containing protein [Velocimicrobium porci]|uniref:DUF342 domain-containing protein n=1 Tax=Velocimicrobium porci TaxID=2606634 RepID=A0A6L5XWL4_9FIRM|nr:FapA family protein [Velocimicrobium porci]MSS62984.1 DUF342 domain-containing protein [Velocimicrobium porci]
MEGKNSYFQLVHKEDGTYLKVYPAENGGEKVKYDVVVAYFEQINLTEYSPKEINTALLLAEKEPQEVKITEKEILPEDERVLVHVELDKSKATGIFVAPSSKGKQMSKQDVIDSLVQAGVRFGVKDEAIDEFLRTREYSKEFELALATSAVEGKSAVITYHFNTDLNTKPKVNEDGSVDFHHLDMINHVNKGDVLATLDPVDYGKNGIDVCGGVIKPKKVVAKVLKHGKNIHLSEDGCTMYSDVDGHVTLADDRVFVSDTYEVPADVGVASGDIEYEGNVEVKGNVISGFKVKAKGDIIVNGVVEGATLIAGGQIILKRGIQGMGKGVLEAKGNIVAKFMENCKVITDGEITTDAIMHSDVIAKGSITVGGKKGMITGGNVRTTANITATTLGSVMGTQTNLTIAIDQAILDEFKQVEERLEQIEEEQKKLVEILKICAKKKMTGTASKEVVQAEQTAALKAKQLQAENQKCSLRHKVLKMEIENYKGGRIKFSGSAYPGVKVTICNSTLYIKNETVHGQFVRDRAEICTSNL